MLHKRILSLKWKPKTVARLFISSLQEASRPANQSSFALEISKDTTAAETAATIDLIVVATFTPSTLANSSLPPRNSGLFTS